MPDTSLLTQIFEAYPAATFVVDEDVRVQLVNRAARALLGPGEDLVNGALKRGGELLHCVNARKHPDGCGHAEACRDCVIRGSVGKAFRSGAVARQQAQVSLVRDGRAVGLMVIVSASPIDFPDVRLTVLTIEDVSELMRLQPDPFPVPLVR